MNVLFVCLGNICRSAIAEFIAKDIITKYKLTNITIDSCGTSNEHEGQDMYYLAKQNLISHNIKCNDFKSKPITQNLIDWSDIILVMDKYNYNDVVNNFNNVKHKVSFMLDYIDYNSKNVPDPWYDHNFELVYNLLTTAINNFLKQNNFIK